MLTQTDPPLHTTTTTNTSNPNSSSPPQAEEPLNRPILEEFVKLNGVKHQVTLSRTHFSYQRCVFPKGSIVSMPVADLLSAKQEGNIFVLTGIQFPTTILKEKKKGLFTYRFEFDTAEAAENWVLHFYKFVYNTQLGQPPDPFHVLVLINPFSGTKKGIRVFDEFVKPLFSLAPNFTFEQKLTDYANHAFDIVKGLDISQYQGIVCVSGDGLLNEAVNGLLSRKDWATASKKVTFGIIPAGSGNGLSASLNHDQLEGALAVAKRKTRPLDVYSALQSGERIRFGFLQVEWALLSEVDFESEKFRWLGELRFTLQAVASIARIRRYPARISFLPDRSVEKRPCNKNMCHHCIQLATQLDEPFIDSDQSSVPEEHFYHDLKKFPAELLGGDISTIPQRRQSAPAASTTSSSISLGLPYSASSRDVLEAPNTIECSSARDTLVHNNTNPVLSVENQDLAPAQLPEGWESIEGEFSLICLTLVPDIGSNTRIGPYAHVGDGYMDLVAVKAGLSRLELVAILLKLEDGDFVNDEKLAKYIIYEKVKAFCIEPKLHVNGLLGIDGEKIPYKPVHIIVHPKLLTIFGRT